MKVWVVTTVLSFIGLAGGDAWGIALAVICGIYLLIYGAIYMKATATEYGAERLAFIVGIIIGICFTPYLGFLILRIIRWIDYR